MYIHPKAEKTVNSLKSILCLSVFLFLIGCTEVYFTESQPRGKKYLKEIPPEMHGWFVDSNGSDSVHVRTRGFDFPDETATLSDSIALTKWKDFYFLNIRDNSKGLWEVYMIQKVNAYEIQVSSIDGEKKVNIDRLKGYTTVTSQVKSDGEIDYYLINPSSKEFKSLVKDGFFENQMVYRKVN